MGAPSPVRAASIDTAGPAASVVAPFLAAAHRRWLADEAGVRWRRRPASLVIGHLSGFTEPSEVLDGAVGRLLDSAAAHGGDLLKYSGDSMLLTFEGPGHERRATQTAAALPAALRGLPGESPGAQPAMSIGVATGEIDLFLVGADHRELIACGPLVSRAVKLGFAAHGGEVLADGTTVAAVNDARWSAPDRVGHLLLIPPPASTVGLGLTPNGLSDLPMADLLAGIPAGLRAHLGADDNGKHRPVAVAAIQVIGVDDLLDRAGPAAVADALEAVVRAAQEACATYRTTFLSTVTDDGAVRLILTAGAPDAGADDVGRLLLATRRVVATDCALPVRAGVHHGPSFVVELGSDRRRVYAVLGDVMNVAARLMGQSESGIVLATDSALAASRTSFGSTAWHPPSGNGTADPLRASRVGAQVEADGVRSDVRSPLVGRDAERQLLLTALDEARAGNGRTVVILGEPGIGKSRLLAETIAAAPDLPRLHIVGNAYPGESPYAALWAALRRLLDLDVDAAENTVLAALRDMVGPNGEPWLPLVAPVFGAALPDTSVTARVEARSRRQRSHGLVTDVLRHLLPDGALVIVDDAHWLDDASTALLRHVLEAFADAPWLIVVGRRDQPGGLVVQESAAVTRIVLEPLAGDAVAILMPADLDDGSRQALIARGGGNPLFVEQLLASTMEGADVDDLPATVEDLIAGRVRSLDPGRRRQLQAASVIGRRVPTALLASVLGDDPPEPSAAPRLALERDGPGWARFQHPLVREVCYQGLTRRVRRDLHDRIGALIEADQRQLPDRSAHLSFHFTEAQRWEPAWYWSAQAAEQSAACGASVEAAVFLHRALRAAGHLDVEASELSWVYERLADAEEINGRFDDASEALTRSRRLTTEPVRLAYLFLRHGLVSARAGSYVAAQRWFGRGLRELPSGPATADRERIRIDLVVAQAGTKVHQGRGREALQLLEGAIADAEAAGHQPALATAQHLMQTLRC